MPHKIEVEFPADFEHEKPLPIHLGRLMIGHHIARLYFCPDGLVRMTISQGAIDEGSILINKRIDETEPVLFGFGRPEHPDDNREG